MKKRALISVFYKDGVLEFAKFLEKRGVEILSTGGTYKHLKENGVNVIEVNEVTNFPEMLDGRVKTLHNFTIHLNCVLPVTHLCLPYRNQVREQSLRGQEERCKHREQTCGHTAGSRG